MKLENKEFWDKQAKRPLVGAMHHLDKTHKCLFCSKRFDECFLVKRENKTDINDLYQMFTMEFFAHLKMTHGFDPESFINMIIIAEEKHKNEARK